jgi:ribonuclease H / adenosylcobalamin/alpha-ribazole phosphatase
MILYLARHGESDWNVANRFQGVTDRPLTERGRRQAEELAQEVAGKGIDAVYSSPLRRALDTAAIVAGRLGLEPVADPGLREIDVGSWAGLSRAEVESRFPDAFHRWVGGGDGWDDGENYEQMSKRVLAAVARIAGAHPTGSVLLIAHGGPIRAIHAAAAGMDVHAYRRIRPVEPNARLSAVAVEGERVTRID